MREPAQEVYVIEQIGRPKINNALEDAAAYARATFGSGAMVELSGVVCDLDLKKPYWTFSFKITPSRHAD